MTNIREVILPSLTDRSVKETTICWNSSVWLAFQTFLTVNSVELGTSGCSPYRFFEATAFFVIEEVFSSCDWIDTTGFANISGTIIVNAVWYSVDTSQIEQVGSRSSQIINLSVVVYLYIDESISISTALTGSIIIDELCAVGDKSSSWHASITLLLITSCTITYCSLWLIS